jgi:hypothetical protein
MESLPYKGRFKNNYEENTMNKLLTVLLASVLISPATAVLAADAPSDVPPAHQQKKELPDTTKSGDYLQEQPDNNSGGNAGNKQSKPGNIEKSKRFHEKPADGGTGGGQQSK